MSGIHDELVEHPTEEQVDHLIRSPWADRMVRGLVGWQAPFLDDLAQEARIQMWRDAGLWDPSRGGEIEPFLKQRARWRVVALLKGDKRFVGDDHRQTKATVRGDAARDRLRSAMATFRDEHHREPRAKEMAEVLGITERTVYKQMKNLHTTKREVEVAVRSLDAMIEEYGTEAVFVALDHYDAVVLAYHYGEIHQAVADLDPVSREYVYLRFWCGTTDKEASETLGIPPFGWSTKVRPLLAERLSHLVGAL